MATEFEKIAADAYFMKSEIIRFLLVENMAMRQMLFEKGVIDDKEFAVYKTKATEILDAKVKEQLSQWQQAHPDLYFALQSQLKADPNPRPKDPAGVSA